jgi:hypothetical protein
MELWKTLGVQICDSYFLKLCDLILQSNLQHQWTLELHAPPLTIVPHAHYRSTTTLRFNAKFRFYLV